MSGEGSMMNFKHVGALSGLLLGAFAVQGVANAACLQRNAAGTWQAYSISSLPSEGSTWVRCKLSISSAGKIKNNTCTDPYGGTYSMVGGKILLSNKKACTFTGYFTLGGIPHTIGHSTMSRDKIRLEGVGWWPTGNFNFTLNKI